MLIPSEGFFYNSSVCKLLDFGKLFRNSRSFISLNSLSIDSIIFMTLAKPNDNKPDVKQNPDIMKPTGEKEVRAKAEPINNIIPITFKAIAVIEYEMTVVPSLRMLFNINTSEI
ncbi:MAG: hypothetical protein ACYCWE_21105 [Eubacteriales bacterium]